DGGGVGGLFDPMLDALPSLGTLAVMVVGGVRLGQHAVSVADIVSVAFLFSVLAVPVRALGFVLGELPRAAVGMRRVQGVLQATGEMVYGTGDVDAGSASPASAEGEVAAPLPLRFEHVSFR